MGGLSVRDVRRAGAWRGAAERVALDHAARARGRLVTAAGETIDADPGEAGRLEPGDALELEDGRLIEVVAAEEPLYEVRGPEIARYAWHAGCRHAPCEIAGERLLIPRDAGLAQHLAGLGAEVAEVTEPFRPEPGEAAHRRVQFHSSHTHPEDDEEDAAEF